MLLLLRLLRGRPAGLGPVGLAGLLPRLRLVLGVVGGGVVAIRLLYRISDAADLAGVSRGLNERHQREEHQREDTTP